MLAGNRNEQKALREMEKPPVDWEKEDHLGDRETVEKTLERTQWTSRRSGTGTGDVDKRTLGSHLKIQEDTLTFIEEKGMDKLQWRAYFEL
jgi:hypothetical protein